MFRGKESSNRIELSRLVQDLLNFGVSGSLRLWGWGGRWMVVGGWVYGGGGWLGVAPYTHAHAHTHTHAHARTCIRGKHDNFMQMAAPIGGIPGNSLWCHMRMCARAHACMRMRVHMGRVHPLTTPHPHPPTPHPTGGDPWNHSKFNSTWTNRDISILFEDLKSVETSPRMGGWVGGWVDGWGQVKSLKIWNLLTESR